MDEHSVQDSDKPSEASAAAAAVPAVPQKVDLGDIEVLLIELLDKITDNLYVNICRGLFE